MLVFVLIPCVGSIALNIRRSLQSLDHLTLDRHVNGLRGIWPDKAEILGLQGSTVRVRCF